MMTEGAELQLVGFDGWPFGGLEHAWTSVGVGRERLDLAGSPRGVSFMVDHGSDPWIRPEPKFDIHVAIGERQKTWYMIALSGIGRDVAAKIAAVNERAFQIAVELMQTQVASSRGVS